MVRSMLRRRAHATGLVLLLAAACGSDDPPSESTDAGETADDAAGSSSGAPVASTGSTGGSGDSTAADDTGNPGDSGTGDPNLLVGTFQIQLHTPQADGGGTTSVFGKLFDGESPDTIVWELASESGDCHLLTPRVPYCAEPCGGSAACVEDDTCQPYPTPMSAGDITVTGIAVASGDPSFTMAPIADNYQPPAGTTLVYPGFAEGDVIALSASGDPEGEQIGAFDLEGTGIAPLELTHGEITLDAAADIALSWIPAGGSVDSEVHVKLDISHHGGTKGMIECVTADSGGLDVSAALVSGLLDLGVAGFPTIIITRRATSSVTTSAGRVDLVVSSGIEEAVIVEGVVSCTDDSECADGQTCQADLTCQ